MSEQKEVRIVEQPWDFLIILDACRYDYFEQFYSDYLTGDLSKKISMGSCTDEWRNKNFPNYYEDIVYVTANPQINTTTSVYGYLASDHFKYVHEIWKECWDEQCGTVRPEIVTEKAMEIISSYGGDKRFIVHYLQPHAPYINAIYKSKRFIPSDMSLGGGLLKNLTYQDDKTSIIKQWLYKICYIFETKVLKNERPAWRIREYLKMSPVTAMESALRELGADGLRNAYKDNLIIALSAVSDLVSTLSGKIVVTADHGELLGEDKQFSHPANSGHPILKQVPWMVIDKGQRTEISQKDRHINDAGHNDKNSRENDELVKQRLRDLGYYI